MFETQPEITIRLLGAGESEALARLAELDSSRAPSGSVLAAVTSDGALLAAISLEDRELVADPFLPSEHAADLLRVRARQVRGEERKHRRARAALPSSPPGAGGRLLELAGLRPPS
jgi:hypothetical protein